MPGLKLNRGKTKTETKVTAWLRALSLVDWLGV